jgi:acetyltransferase-like isoleucine patch superfamily enzyme
MLRSRHTSTVSIAPCRQSGTFRRARNYLRSIAHYVWWRPRFFEFGWKSTIAAVDLLTNPREISIGRRVKIWKGARLEAISVNGGGEVKLNIGDDTSIHMYFHCGAAQSVTIGKTVLIAGRVFISDHDHQYDAADPAAGSRTLRTSAVVIEDGVWIGEGAVILKGVTVGERSVIGANSVVTRDVPPFSVVAGAPARVIKQIDVRSTPGQTSDDCLRDAAP